jgi:choline dehydrogenase-like flavoprotein
LIAQSLKDISLTSDLNFDVVVVGSGPGGSLSALKAAQQGKKVAILEMGRPLQTKDFVLDEATAYKNLYQEAAGRTSLDGAITILQGRALGGGSTVNWTSSFRTPELTLKYWQKYFGLKDLSMEKLLPFFKEAEALIGVKDWEIAPNRNNDLLAEGLSKIGAKYGFIKRNVRGCQNLGYCGLGCPVGAKQSALVTSLPMANKLGAEIFCDAVAERLIWKNSQVEALEVSVRGIQNQKFLFKAKTFICAAGAIGSPALLLRSKVADPHQTLGKRTFIHPTTISGAIFKEKVEAYYGAPQTVYSDHFLPSDLEEKAAGFKLEVPPIHPLLLATSVPLFGRDHYELMKNLPYIQATIALQRDGFHPESQGGRVILKNGRPFLDYKFTPYMEKAFRQSLLVMGEAQLAAGAYEVMPIHRQGMRVKSLRELKKHIFELPMKALELKVVSAHVMGGCAMGLTPQESVTDTSGRFHHLENLVIRDGSLFPTGVGTNPMLSIMGLVGQLSS